MTECLTISKIVDVYRIDNYVNWKRDFFDTRKFDGVMLFIDGEIQYNFGFKKVTAKKGDVLFLPGNLPYSGVKISEAVTLIVVDFLCLKENEFEKLGAPFTLSVDNFSSMLNAFSNIHRSWNSQFLSSDFEIKSYLYSILSEKYKQGEKLRNNIPTDDILEFVSQNIIDVELSLKSLCKKFYISESQLRRNIHKRTGMSPNEYITTLRIDKAKNELLSTDKSIKFVAYDCGFASQYYFSKVFSKKVGLSPSEYRRRIQNQI